MKKPLLYSILALVVVIIVLLFLLGRYTDRVIDPYVRSLLEQTKPMGHRITYDKIRVNLFAKFIKLKDVRMFPDSSVSEHDVRIEGEVKEILLTGFSIREMLFHKTLKIGIFLIEKPSVIVTLPMEHGEAIKEFKEEESLKKKSSPILTRIFLDEIDLTDGSFKLIRNNVILATSPDIDVIAQEISLKKDNADEPIGFEYGNLEVYLSDIDLNPESSLYEIKIGKFAGVKKDSTIMLRHLKVKPLHDKKEFARKLEFQNDRFDAEVGLFKIKYVKIRDIIDGNPFHITQLSIDSLKADIHRDKNVSFNFDRFPSFYNESFLKIPIPVYIDSVSVTNSRIQYEEVAEGKDTPGIIVLENFNVQSHDLTNLVEEDTVGNIMRFSIQARVMGDGPLNAEVILPLEGKLHDIEVSGSVGAMALAPLNSMLEPEIGIRIDEGKVNRMTFYFKGNDHSSYGWMEFLYKDLKVEILKKDPDKKFGFLSSLANAVALSNNPPEGKAEKIVEISYERDKNKGIINYIWKTIQSGMVRTILPTSKYQINKQQAQEINKLNRQQARTEKKLDKQVVETEKAKEKTTESPKEKKEKKKN